MRVRLGAYLRLSRLMFFHIIRMFASHVSTARCDLFGVVRTDLSSPDYDRQLLSYPPADYLTCVYRAAEYQQTFDPSRRRYDYRVTQLG